MEHNSTSKGGCNLVIEEVEKKGTSCGPKDKLKPCMEFGKLGHFTFQCLGLQWLVRHPNLRGEFEGPTRKAEPKSCPKRKEDISEDQIGNRISVSPM